MTAWHLGYGDWFLLALVVAIMPVYSYFGRARLAKIGVADRRPLYLRTMISLGVMGALVLEVWYASGRPFIDLGFALPPGTATTAAAFVCVMAVLATGLRARNLARMAPERIARMRERLGGAGALLPRTGSELGWFFALSLFAGTCEELLYRGYLFAIASPYLLWPVFVLIGACFFGLGHLYQGWRGVLMTGLIGVFLGCFYIVTDSILWPMLLHALIDVNGGLTGFMLLRGAREEVRT